MLPPFPSSVLVLSHCTCLLVKQKSHAIRNIGFLCLLTYSSLWPLYLLWALSAPGTFYACNHFLCTWDDLISTFLMQMPFTFLSGLVRLLSSSTGTVWKRSAESDSPVLFFPRGKLSAVLHQACDHRSTVLVLRDGLLELVCCAWMLSSARCLSIAIERSCDFFSFCYYGVSYLLTNID